MSNAQIDLSSHGHDHENLAPKPLLIAAAGLVLSVLALVTFSQITGIGKATPTPLAVTQSVSINFVDDADGGVGVLSAETGTRIYTYPPASGGFVRVALRALAVDRFRMGIGSEPPFTLAQTQEGVLVLSDPSTGKRVTLEAFGSGNAETFSALLTADSETTS